MAEATWHKQLEGGIRGQVSTAMQELNPAQKNLSLARLPNELQQRIHEEVEALRKEINSNNNSMKTR